MFKFFSDYFARLDSRKLLKKKDFKKLEQILKIKITNPKIFVEALTHRSVLDGVKFPKSNERMEFLGDAVLNFLVAEYLFEKFPSIHEGTLTKMRANLVNKNTLFEAAKSIDLFQFLFIHEDVLVGQAIGIRTILSDAFESVIGAVFLHSGIDHARYFVHGHVIEPNLKKGVHLVDENYKSQLLEFVQRMHIDMPRYFVVNEAGPEHDREFTVQVAIGDKIVGDGKGKNKKSAEQSAAKKALEIILASQAKLGIEITPQNA